MEYHRGGKTCIMLLSRSSKGMVGVPLSSALGKPGCAASGLKMVNEIAPM